MKKNEKMKIWDLYGGAETHALNPNLGFEIKTPIEDITKMNKQKQKIDTNKLQQILNYKPKQLQEKKIKIGNMEFYAPIGQVKVHEFDKFIPSTTINQDI